jgi:hypothetical protein
MKGVYDIREAVENGDYPEAFSIIADHVRLDWITFAQRMTGTEWNCPEMRGIMEKAIEHFAWLEEFETCRLIHRANEFLKWRRLECEE